MFSFVVAAVGLLLLARVGATKLEPFEQTVALLAFWCSAYMLVWLLEGVLSFFNSSLVKPFQKRKQIEHRLSDLHPKERAIIAHLLSSPEKFVRIENPIVEREYFTELSKAGLIDFKITSGYLHGVPDVYTCSLTAGASAALRRDNSKFARKLGLT